MTIVGAGYVRVEVQGMELGVSAKTFRRPVVSSDDQRAVARKFKTIECVVGDPKADRSGIKSSFRNSVCTCHLADAAKATRDSTENGKIVIEIEPSNECGPGLEDACLCNLPPIFEDIDVSIQDADARPQEN